MARQEILDLKKKKVTVEFVSFLALHNCMNSFGGGEFSLLLKNTACIIVAFFPS